MSEDENKSCLWGRQRYINKKKKKKRIVWYHWYWYNNYWKTTYQGNLNCFFLCFVSLHRYTHKHALRIFHYSCSALSGFGSSLLFYTSFPSLDSIDGSATQAHVFISLSKLLLTTRTPPAQKKKKKTVLCYVVVFRMAKIWLGIWDSVVEFYGNAKQQRMLCQFTE